ncbi:hypothetical protein SLEP1_g16510 [Rubroshorea leprosula]|uniref:Reverse transcriptase domain-containing protein n=1 Tax=Rubroshorea leprosula TaxID=152421 RepID=A0AAV5J1L5_9ROSI|nr:hypothetical protein SLEP1_g16510 [Rubroshorea leprosula]
MVDGQHSQMRGSDSTIGDEPNRRIGHGRVLEIDCPAKRDRMGRLFGFVWFLDVRNEGELERRLNEVRVGNQVLQANKPRYTKWDRQNNLFPRTHFEDGNWRQQSINGNDRRPSYAEVVKTTTSRMEERPINERRKVGIAQRYGSNNDSIYGNQQREWKPKHQHHHWSGMELNFDLEEYVWLEKWVFFCNIRPMGGRLVLLEGKDHEDLKELVDTGTDWLGNWFEDVKPWTPTLVATERFAWIRCQGLPMHAWKLETFQTFGRLWGTLISLDDSTINKKRFDAARFLITTPSTESISKSITVKINGEFFTLKFTEEESTNNLFTMRFDRNFHATREKEDEENNSSDSQNEDDSDLDKNIWNQFELQIVGVESEGAQASMEEDAATPYTEDGNKNEVVSYNAKVVRHSAEVARHSVEMDRHGDKVEGNKRKKVKTVDVASTDTEVVEETEGMEEIRTGILVSNSNFQRVVESRKIKADPDLVINKAEQRMFKNGSQLSTNADMGSHGKSYQKSINKAEEDNRSRREAEKYAKEVRDGLPTKEMGPEENIGLRDHQPTELQGPTNSNPEEQIEKSNNRPIAKNRKSSSSFWDDLESDSGTDQKLKGQRRVVVKTKKKVMFEKDSEKSVADDSINDSNIQNCNKNIEVAQPTNGAFGGILIIWNSNVFKKIGCLEGVGFLGVVGIWGVENTPCYLKSSGKEGKGGISVRRELKEFNKFIEMSGLVDLPIIGRKFTWYQSNGNCMSRLDRFLFSEEWLLNWTDLKQWRLARLLSDHYPILVKDETRNWGPKPFKFYNVWLQDPAFREMLEKQWKSFNIQEEMARQKSRMTWMKEGDANTSFFHRCIKNRRRRNEINSLVVNRKVLQEVNELKQGVADYFKNLFAKEDWKRPVLEGMGFNKISEADKELLTEPFLESEVKAAVWNCDSAKAPGPNGLSFRFLKAELEVVKDDILKFLVDFHNNSKLVRGSNSSFLVLIPKKENLQGLEKYRPISLIGCMYKILTKILANRLSKVLNGLIGEQQSAFIGGRQLFDGIVIANETIDEIRKKKLSCFLFKADFEKAYDNVNWEFLDYMLDRMNFGLVWKGWMGLRQGDPLAPFLFLIVAEGLNGIISSAVDKALFEGVQIGRGDLRISHL